MKSPLPFSSAWTSASFRAPWVRGLGPIAIEYRDGVARLAQVEVRSGEVVAAARVPHDPARPERSAELIGRVLRSNGFHGRACIVGLPYAAARAETMVVDDGDDDSIRAAIEREAPLRFGCAAPQAGFLRLSLPTAVAASTPVGQASGAARLGRVEVAAIVADRPMVEALLHPLIDCGILPEAAEPSFVSAARACSRMYRRGADRDRVRLAVDSSLGGAVVMLLAGERIAYCRSIDEIDLLPGAVAECLHDGLPYVAGCGSATEIRLGGARAEDAALSAALEQACGLPIRLDDAQSTIGTAWRAITARVAREDRPWDWAGVLGLSFRRTTRRAVRDPSGRLDREAA